MRADAKMTPLMHPKVEQATKSGISHAITPIVREAKVCKAQGTWQICLAVRLIY